MGKWRTTLKSGLLSIRNSETNLGKLTLSFDLSASAAKPISVRVESFDANRKRTGARVGTIYPAAPDFFQRYALDLSNLKPDGTGKFDPTAPFVQFSFEGGSAADGTRGEYQIRLDNVNYSTPAFYVSPKGSDQSDGRTEKTAFATPQKALDVAQPGDIICLMQGTYDGGSGGVASFRRGGAPDAWIVLKNYPGQKPTLTSTGWNIVSIAGGSKEKPSDDPSLCYLEIRGLHVRGVGDVAKTKYPDAMNKPDSRTNSNGIAVDGRYLKNHPHHLRIADNLVEYCTAGGIGVGESDWFYIENNLSRYNSWTTIYATSGISTLGAFNFDAQDNVYKILVRNNVCYRNETFEIWEEIKKPSDGNGIIIDVNQGTNDLPNSKYIGRTLVQSNLCFDNGGSGIHTVKANRVDIINNTAYLNSASKNLEYSQIFTYGSQDVRIINNILIAPVANLAADEKPEPVNKIADDNANPNKDVVFSHNIYFGGNIPATLGKGDVIADPQFVKPTRDPKIADFHLKPGSPAVGKGVTLPFSPF
ncbi:MAG: hypothetical protein H7145_15220, partial [Akkermansiaceae bacterium]|nr:hypothetical protein [Armatimonadota bacterium]